jgi:hypothetical protein
MPPQHKALFVSSHFTDTLQVKKLLPIILLLTACSTNQNKVDKAQNSKDTLLRQNSERKDISDPTNTLSGKTETLELDYIVWGCACANWATPSDFKKYQDNKLAEHCIFIEPANNDLELPMYFDPGRHFIKVTGQFYVRPDYPKGTIQGEEQLDKARVFRYTKIDVFKKDIEYPAKDDTTLNLSYNAIECTCAQWSDTKSTADTVREYYFLEPANDKLINADRLWKGDNIPLQIQVTGQIVSYAGYPTGYNPTKGDPKAEMVFRYTKIKVIKNGQTKNGY